MYAAHGAYGRVCPYCHTQSVATHGTNKNCANMQVGIIVRAGKNYFMCLVNVPNMMLM